MAQRKDNKSNAEQALALVEAQERAPVELIDSSSNDEDLVVAEGCSEDSNTEYEPSLSERYGK